MEIKNNVFEKGGEPFLPIMGEFQYSRTDRRCWDKDMKKMKALGINVLSTYSFWIHHEEIEGSFDFSGNKDIRLFLNLAKKNGLDVCLRIGPWVHAECRNGGFPDWIYDKGCKLRENDPAYLRYVERYFCALFEQCRGLLNADGGPITSIQVENEYSQWGRQGPTYGDAHINELISMLKRIGFDVPVYFATGWGKAAIGNAVPVWGAYCEAPWEDSDEELPPVDGYLFSPNPNDKSIGSETGKKDFDLSSGTKLFPYATVELGSGIQITHKRRPIIKGVDNAAIAFCRLGSGVDALGYYVFHGGIHPTGKLASMQEYKKEGPIEAGFACDLPEKDYDFQAAVSQYGKVRESGKELKLINTFAAEFKDILLGGKVVFPKDNAVDPNDLESPRYCFRGVGESGFLFINSYVRHYHTTPQNLYRLLLTLGFDVPGAQGIEIPDGIYSAVPLNLKVGDSFIRFSSAMPLMVLNGKDVVFYSSLANPVMDADKGRGQFLMLSKEDTVNCYKFNIRGKEYAFVSGDEVYQDGDAIHIIHSGPVRFKTYPSLPILPEGFSVCPKGDGWFLYQSDIHVAQDVYTSFSKATSSTKKARFAVEFKYGTPHCDVFAYFDFAGDSLDFLVNGHKENDCLYYGKPFEVSLGAYGFPTSCDATISPLKKGEKIYLEKWPEFEADEICELEDVRTLVFDELVLHF